MAIWPNLAPNYSINLAWSGQSSSYYLTNGSCQSVLLLSFILLRMRYGYHTRRLHHHRMHCVLQWQSSREKHISMLPWFNPPHPETIIRIRKEIAAAGGDRNGKNRPDLPFLAARQSINWIISFTIKWQEKDFWERDKRQNVLQYQHTYCLWTSLAVSGLVGSWGSISLNAATPHHAMTVSLVCLQKRKEW